jgi:hypothetical protein
MSELQIFVSYARDDDAQPPDSPDAKGFVTSLYDQIRYEFAQRGERRPKLWRDVRRIGKADQFDAVIEDAINASSIMVVVLSPNWMASRYCRLELEKFAKRWRDDAGLRERIVVVGKRHVDPDKRPSLLQRQEGFRFYALNDPDEVAPEHEFFVRGKVRDSRYYDLVEELARFLCRRWERAGGLSGPGPEPEPPSVSYKNGRTVFVAKPAIDMRDPYDRLVKELSGRGYAVVPDAAKDIPLDSSAVEFLNDALGAAEISVHLLGEKFGATPEDIEEPIVKLQLSLAAARRSDAGAGAPSTDFRRIIWAPKLIDSAADPANPAIERNPLEVLAKFGPQLGTDKISGDCLSKFVDFLTQHLLRVEPPKKRPVEIKGNSRVYLYHSIEDTEYAFALQDALQNRQIEIVLPVFDGPDAEVKSFHRKYLAECNAVALCWGAASEVWVRAQSSELRDWHNLGRTEQFAYRSVVAGPPPGNRKKGIRRLFPPSEIDVIVDLADKAQPLPELLDRLVPHSPLDAP